MMPARKRQFLSAGPVTAPTAGSPPVPEPPALQPAPAASSTPARAAFTWRRTADQAITMDELALKLKRELKRPRLDHAQILAAMLDIATESPAVYGALVAKLQED